MDGAPAPTKAVLARSGVLGAESVIAINYTREISEEAVQNTSCWFRLNIKYYNCSEEKENLFAGVCYIFKNEGDVRLFLV